MNRRGFLRGSVAVAIAAPAVANASIARHGGLRVSNEKGDAGYRAYCMARRDGKKVKVYLDGEHQKGAIMGDESLGIVKRFVFTEKGNLAHDGRDVFTEEVHGLVEIVFE